MDLISENFLELTSWSNFLTFLFWVDIIFGSNGLLSMRGTVNFWYTWYFHKKIKLGPKKLFLSSWTFHMKLSSVPEVDSSRSVLFITMFTLTCDWIFVLYNNSSELNTFRCLCNQIWNINGSSHHFEEWLLGQKKHKKIPFEQLIDG